jgi:hypothetical protein
MVHLEPNAMVLMPVLVLTHPKLGVVAAMAILLVALNRVEPQLVLWVRIAVMGIMPALYIWFRCQVETIL